MEKLRLFIAVEIPIEVIDIIQEIQFFLRKKEIFKGTFVKSDNLHLTLKFLGDTSDELIPSIIQNLKLIKFQSIQASTGSLGFFSPERIRVIWLSIVSQELLLLQNKIENNLRWFLETENNFVSHLTIARIKSIKNRSKLEKIISEINVPKIFFTVDSFILKSSELTQNGPIYQNIEIFRANK